MFIDTHCHLDDHRFAGNLPDIRRRAKDAGIGKIIIPGTGPASWARIAALTRSDKQLHPAFGLHPMLADQCTGALLASLGQYAQSAVAIGEIGLDYTLADATHEAQIVAFRAQLRLAIKLGLPVMIHCRNAFHDLLNILREEQAAQIGGVMHAFSGSPETAAECIKLGFSIAIAGTVTWDNAIKPLKVVAATPLEYLLLETDAPDLTPEPYRGQCNEPAFLLEIARKVAEIKRISTAEVAAITTANAVKLFRLT